VRRTKLAIRHLLGARKYSIHFLMYRVLLGFLRPLVPEEMLSR